jgi:hypothetical protein
MSFHAVAMIQAITPTTSAFVWRLITDSSLCSFRIEEFVASPMSWRKCECQRSRGDGCECKNGAQRSFCANVIARSDDLRTTTTDGDVNAVGAMDVSAKTERSGVLART